VTFTIFKDNKQIKILSIIFVGLMIPNVIVYAEHSLLEFHESEKSLDQQMINKSTRQLSEGIFFALVAIGYVVTTIFIFIILFVKLFISFLTIKGTTILEYYHIKILCICDNK